MPSKGMSLGESSMMLTDSILSLRLSLVRAPTSPDTETDQGNHEIDFAIFPHQGQLASSQVQTEALKFNNEVYGTSTR